jgi:putative transposase
MTRTLKEATVRTYHYETFSQLRRHIAHYLAAYNSFAMHFSMPKVEDALRETVQALWESKPGLFWDSPNHHTLGPNT